MIIKTYLPAKEHPNYCFQCLHNYARSDVPFDLQAAFINQGAIHKTADPWSANSISDGNLVTGQNPASAKGVGENMVALLEEKA